MNELKRLRAEEAERHTVLREHEKAFFEEHNTLCQISQKDFEEFMGAINKKASDEQKLICTLYVTLFRLGKNKGHDSIKIALNELGLERFKKLIGGFDTE